MALGAIKISSSERVAGRSMRSRARIRCARVFFGKDIARLTVQATIGTGLVGLVAGLLGAQKVVITDQEYVCNHCQVTIIRGLTEIIR